MSLMSRIKGLFASSEGAPRDIWGVGEGGTSFLLGGWEEGFQRNLSTHVGELNTDAFACANIYATALSGVGLHHIRKLDNGGVEIISDSPAARFARYPNEYQTESDFFLVYVMRLLLNGNAIAVAQQDERFDISQVHILHTNRPNYYVDPETQAIFYRGNDALLGPTDNVDDLIPSRYVAHARLYCPRHPLQGVSPISYAGYSAGLGNLVRASTATFFKNQGRPSGHVEMEDKLTQEQAESLRKRLDDQTKGWNMGGTPIFSAGMKWKPAQMTAVDAQVIETLKMTSLDIARCYGIPAALANIEGAMSVTSTEALINQWRAQGLNFVAQHIERTFERLFKLPANEEFRFDLDNLARSDFASRVQSLTNGIQQGLFSPNEARAMQGLKAVEFGDEPRVQAQVVPLSQVEMMNSAAAAPAPAAPAQEPANEKSFAERKQHYAAYLKRYK